MMTKFSLLLVLVLSVQAYAQSDVDQQRANLVGANGRVWVFKAFDAKIDDPRKCISGAETWAFAPNGKVHIKKCVANKIERSELNWSIAKQGIDYIVTLGGGQQYRFIYSKPASRRHQMRLRGVAGVKEELSVDRVFTYWGK